MNAILILWDMLGRRIRKKEREFRVAMAKLQEADGVLTQAEEGAKALADGLAECRAMVDKWLEGYK